MLTKSFKSTDEIEIATSNEYVKLIKFWFTVQSKLALDILMYHLCRHASHMQS